MSQTIKQVPPERVLAAWKIIGGVRVDITPQKPQTPPAGRKES